MIFYSALGKVGRLGNQLFQIASAIGIAEKFKTKAAFPAWKYEQYFDKPLNRIDTPNAIAVKETSYHYNPAFLDSVQADKNYDIAGYLQSEKYWKHAEDLVRSQFTFKATLKENVRNKFTDAFTKPTLAISVRRGDFIGNPNYYQIPLTYYLYAYYELFGSDYSVIIFSDDIKYCKLHFSAIPNVFFAEGLSDIEQLYLMSMCENFIISNSTFSWWGAYLSGSKNVIRPVKNMDGELGKVNDEKDYWQKAWLIYEPGKYDLTNTTFVIPVYYDHPNRRHNLMLTIAWLLKHFDTNIIVGEQGNAFEWLKPWCNYVRFDYKEWHRTKMINEMCRMAKTPVVVNWDADNMLAPAQIIEAVNAVADGADIVYPFDGNVFRVPRYLFAEVARTLDISGINTDHCRHPSSSSVGHAVVMNRKSFIDAGMENEKFISWGPEDSERYDRYNTLGLKVQRINGAVYHMDHYCGETSSSQNKFFLANMAEHRKVKNMSKEQLKSYIKTW